MSQTKLHDLIALAQEPSSEKRRQLLRGVTDLFFTREDAKGSADLALFDDVMTQLAGEMEVAVRAELSERLATIEKPPRRLLGMLANDDTIAVARPILENSPALTDEELVGVVRTRGQDHLRAISHRPTVSETVSEAIVERGDAATLQSLLANTGAQMSRLTHERIVDKATESPELHSAVVRRAGLPADLLNEMYFIVETRLRDEIMTRTADLDPAELDRALAAGRTQLATRDGALPADYAAADKAIMALKTRNGLTAPVLAALLRNGEITKFLLALSVLADIDFHTARRILERKELDALSIVSKAAGFDRSLYLTFVVLILDGDDNAMGKAKTYGDLYEALPLETAQRTVRFWRMRRQTGDLAAA